MDDPPEAISHEEPTRADARARRNGHRGRKGALGYALDPSSPGDSKLSTPDSEEPKNPARASALLFAGAALGLALATFGLLEPQRRPEALGEDVAARVGERTIRRVDYERVLAGVEGDRRNPVDEPIRRKVLERMIDEELLVQRALELGLATIDRRVRGELTSGLIDSIVGEADADEASEADVRRHFESYRDFFSRPGRLRAEALFFSARSRTHAREGDAGTRARRALERLRAGSDPTEVAEDWADPQLSPLPDALLPPAKVRDYVGPILLDTLERLEPGVWSEPVASGGGVYLVRVIDREPPVVPAFEEVESVVREDLARRRGDEALRRYLDELRARTKVVINESVFREGISAEK